MVTLSKTTALILIDIQKGFEEIDYWGGERNNLQAEQNASQLLKNWRELKLPVFHIMHCSTNPKSPLHESQSGNEIQEIVKPIETEIVKKKSVNSAFIGTNLEADLKQMGIQQLVIAGLTTDHCISTSVRMAANLGFDTILVEDATATFCKKGLNNEHFTAELIHQTALASLNQEFAEILTTQEIINKLQHINA